MQRVLKSLVCLSSLPLSVRWGCAVVLVLLAFAARFALFGPGPAFPYLLFFPAVIASAVLLGHGSGIVAALSSAALAVCFSVPPVGSLSVAGPVDALGATLYLAIAVFIAWMVETLHAAYVEMIEAQAVSEAARARAEAGERERDLLLAERDHRVKNDMQRLVGLLAMQARGASPEVAAALRNAAERVKVVARLHDRLVPSGGGTVAVDEFLACFAADLRASFEGLRPVRLHVGAEAHRLPLDRASAVALVASELVTNALKHAFPGEREGAIRIAFRREGADYVLAVSDDGVGLTPEMRPAPPGVERRSGGLGRRITRALAAQLGGRIEVRNPVQVGAMVTLRFPVLAGAGEDSGMDERAPAVALSA